MKLRLTTLVLVSLCLAKGVTIQQEFAEENSRNLQEELNIDGADLDIDDSESIQELFNDPDFNGMPLHEELVKLMEEMSNLGMGKEDLENMELEQEYMDRLNEINEVKNIDSELWKFDSVDVRR